MSAFFSFVYDDRVHLLTDCAVFNDDDDRLFAVREKVARSEKLALILTGRGRFVDVLSEIRALIAFDTCGSFDRFLDLCRAYLKSRRGALVRPHAEILIAGISDSGRPCHYYYDTHGLHPSYPQDTLNRMPAQFGAGPSITISDLPHNLQCDIGSPMFPILHGADVMEAMRRKPATIVGSTRVAHVIGGACQLTSVTKEGSVTMTLHTWPDKVGERITP